MHMRVAQLLDKYIHIHMHIHMHTYTQLLDKYGLANVMAWHGCATREEAWEVLLRHADHVLEERS